MLDAIQRADLVLLAPSNPVSSIGPLRARYLDRLRADPALAALINPGAAAAADDPSGPVQAR